MGDGFVIIRGVKLYTQGMAIKLLGISRPGFYKWVAAGKIGRMLQKGENGVQDRWFVSDAEIKRVKEIIDGGWVRGKSKLPKTATKSKKAKK